MRYQDINYINHVDQYNTENERYANRWKNIHEYQQFLKESNPLYFESEFISFLHQQDFKQIIPFIEGLDINNDKLIVKHNCDSEQYINLCLVTSYFIKYPTLYRIRIIDALRFLINYWYFYGNKWNKGLNKAAMTGNWELPKFKPQRYLNEKLTNKIDPNLSTWNNFKVPMEVSLTGEIESIEYTLEKLGFLELLTTYYAINDYYKKQNLYDFVYPESLFVDMFSFDDLNDFRERMKNIGIAVPKDDKYIKIEEYNENSFINKIIHLDENFVIKKILL